MLPVTTVAVQMRSDNGFYNDLTVNPVLLAGLGFVYDVNWKLANRYFLGFSIKSIFDIDIAIFQLYNPYGLTAAAISAVSYIIGNLPGVLYIKFMQYGAFVGFENIMTLSQFFGEKSNMLVFEPGILFSMMSLILSFYNYSSIFAGPYLFLGYSKVWVGWDKILSKYVRKNYVIGGFLGTCVEIPYQIDTFQRAVTIAVGMEYRTGWIF